MPPLSRSLSSTSTGSVPHPFSVSLTVAESAADFNALASYQIRRSSESHPYIPVLPSSDSEAAVIALQVTLFPNQGFCIGVSSHHAVLEGKSATLFIKAWAHLSSDRAVASSLPEELTPFFDQSIVKDPEGVDQACLDFWTGLAHPGMGNPDRRSLKLAPSLMESNSSDSVRATFIVSQARIQMLRERVTAMMMKNSGDDNKKIRLSSFTLTFAHSMVCLVKAKRLGIGSDADRKVVHLAIAADARGRLKPPLPANYVGNCIVGRHELIEFDGVVKEETEGGGIGFVVERISRMIDDVEEKPTVDKDNLPRFIRNLEASRGVFIGTAGSPKFNVYSADFGWGRPKSVEVTSIDRTGGISMAECRDGSRGIEVGLALMPSEMELFRSAFEA